MRSCSSPVFMEEPAKPISPLYAAALVLVGERQTGGRGWWVQLQRPMRPMGVAGSARGRGARRSMSPFPGTALRTRRASHPGTGLSTRPATNNGCVAARLRSTRPGLPARRRYSPAAPALPTRHRSLAVPFAMCTPLACSDSYGHSPTTRLPAAQWPGRAATGRFPPPPPPPPPGRRGRCQLYPAASPGYAAALPPGLPDRPLQTGCGVARRGCGGRALLTGPHPPGSGPARRLRSVTAGSSRTLLVLLAGPGPSGSADPSRRQSTPRVPRHLGSSPRSFTPGLKGAQMRLCSLAVLMEQTTEQVASMKAALAILADKIQLGGWDRRLKLERPVRTIGVVMLDVDPEHLLQVPAPDEQQPIQALGADGPHPALYVRVCSWRPHWREEHLAALRAEHVIEPEGELRVPIMEQEAHPSPLFAQHQQQVAGPAG